MGLLPGIELGLLPAEPALGFGDLHALPGPQTDQVGLELGDHGQHVKQQPANRVGRIMYRAAAV